MDDETVGLAAAIAALRKELTSALNAGTNEQVQFLLGPIELEVVLEIKKDLGVNGGIKFFVASLEGKGQQSRVSKHRIKLTLNPLNSKGANLKIASLQTTEPP